MKTPSGVREVDPSVRQGVAAGRLCLSEIVSALSFALDFSEGAMPGHAVRSCLLGMRMADALGLSTAEKSDLYYALLLKDVGCSSNAARLTEIAGGQPGLASKVEDLTGLSWAAIRSQWHDMPRGGSLIGRARAMLHGPGERRQVLAAMIGIRSERAAGIVTKIGLTQQTAASIRHLDEHWDGSGYPGHLSGEAIPLASRIVSIAQNLDVFYTRHGARAAMALIRRRGGRWFDPRLVKLAARMHSREQLWSAGDAAANRDMVLAFDPDPSGAATTIQIDRVCEAFADVVDAKSSFTYAHSIGVTRAAAMIAQQLGLAPDRQRLVYRAALLHDIGKLQIPNSILDKPGKLDAGEWMVIREHPVVTQRILERISKFDQIARTASQHHERLDGSGYPHGLRGEHLSMEARVIAVADVYGALSEDRPYRAALGMEEIMSIMSKDVPEKLDRACYDALIDALKHNSAGVTCADGKRLPANAAPPKSSPGINRMR
ncbi:MAG TPA: HD domain-containing phosphohydrolase [Acidisarcina sp.]